MLSAQPVALFSVWAPWALVRLSWSKDVQVETFRSEQPPDDDQVTPDEVKRDVAWEWVSLVTAWASVAPPPRAPTPGTKSAPRTRTSAVRAERSLGRVSMGGFLLLMTNWGTRCAVRVEQGDPAGFYARPPEGRP